jgi:hypothetical protein
MDTQNDLGGVTRDDHEDKEDDDGHEDQCQKENHDAFEQISRHDLNQ